MASKNKAAPANGAPGVKHDIHYSRESANWVFDPQAMSYSKSVHSGDVKGAGKVHHVGPQYYGKGFVTVKTPICFCSGLYINTDKDSGRKTISLSIWLYRRWSKEEQVKTDVEVKHEQMWRDLHKTCKLLDTEEYADVRAKIGVPRVNEEGEPVPMVRIVKPFVRIPKYGDKNPELNGQVDTTRPPRVKAQVWLAKPKESEGPKGKGPSASTALKVVPTGEEKTEGMWGGQRLLCTFENVDGSPRELESLIEQPFLGKFSVVWCSDFFGAHKTHQLKVSHVLVFQLLPKMTRAGMTEEERHDAMEEFAELREEDEKAGKVALVAAPAEDEPESEPMEQDEDGKGKAEPEDEEDEPPKPPPKKESKVKAKEATKEPKAAPAKKEKTKVKVADLTMAED